MRISDWSSDVCSSDLDPVFRGKQALWPFTCIEEYRSGNQGRPGSGGVRAIGFWKINTDSLRERLGVNRFRRTVGTEIYIEPVAGAVANDSPGCRHGRPEFQIGKESCRERVWKLVMITEGGG